MRYLFTLFLTTLTALSADPLILTNVGFGGVRITGVTVQQQAAANTLTNGAVAYWRLDNGTTWTDEAGGFDWIENGTVTAGTGLITNAASFDGNTANCLALLNDPAFSAVANSLTVAGWVKNSGTNADAWVIAKSQTAGTEEWEILWGSAVNAYAFKVWTNSSTSVLVYPSAANIDTNGWYFLAAQINTTNLTARLRVGSTSSLGAWTTSDAFGGWAGANRNSYLWLGRHNDNPSGLTGLVDEVGVWSRTLTDTEITNLWNSGSGKTWPLD